MHLFTRLVCIFTCFMLSNSLISQSMSCCQLSSVKEFSELAKDISFVIIHEEPLPFTLLNKSGKTIKFNTPKDKDAQAYYIEGSKESKKWIFVIQEWWGLNDYIRQEAEYLHKEFPNAHVLALDMYDGNVATTREEAAAFMQAAKPERLENIILGASEYAGKDARIASIGWCFGGAWSIKTATLIPEKSVATVMYYGMPINDEAQIKSIKSPVLGIFASKDGWITPKVVDEFEAKMKQNSKIITVHQYDADHAFANPSNPKYNKEFTADAKSKTVAFLKKYW